MRTFIKILSGTVATIAVVILGLLFWNVYQMGQDETERCTALRNSLFIKIDQAKEVRVIEHSDRWDYPDDVAHSEKIYATVILNDDQKARLKTALILSKDRSANTFLQCIFEPHHRIEITNTDNSMSVIEVCLVCGEIDIGRGHRMLPDGWDVTLKSFISSLSMRPDGPWRINETPSGTSK